MSRRLALELLQKVNNPSHMFTDMEADEDGVRILSENDNFDILIVRLTLVSIEFVADHCS